MSALGLGSRPRPAPLAVAAFAVLAVATPFLLAGAALGRAGLRLEGCVPVGEVGVWLGTRLALVHAAPACPAGTVAPGGAGAQLATVIVCVTVPALLAHLVAGLGAIRALARIRAAVLWVRDGAVRAFARLPRLAAPARVPDAAPRRWRWADEPVPIPAFLATPALRAPPMALAA